MEFTVATSLGKNYDYCNRIFAGEDNSIFIGRDKIFVKIIDSNNHILPINRCNNFIKLLEKKGFGDSLLFINENCRNNLGIVVGDKVKLLEIYGMNGIGEVYVQLLDYETNSILEDFDDSITSKITDILTGTVVNESEQIVIEFNDKKYFVKFLDLHCTRKGRYWYGLFQADTKVHIKNIKKEKVDSKYPTSLNLDIIKEVLTESYQNINQKNIDNVVNFFNGSDKKLPKIVLITGDKKTGKTTVANGISEKFKQCIVKYISAFSLYEYERRERDDYEIKERDEILYSFFSVKEKTVFIFDDLELIIEYFSENQFNFDVAHVIRAFLKNNKIHDIIMTTSKKDEMEKLGLLDSVTYIVN